MKSTNKGQRGPLFGEDLLPPVHELELVLWSIQRSSSSEDKFSIFDDHEVANLNRGIAQYR